MIEKLSLKQRHHKETVEIDENNLLQRRALALDIRSLLYDFVNNVSDENVGIEEEIDVFLKSVDKFDWLSLHFVCLHKDTRLSFMAELYAHILKYLCYCGNNEDNQGEEDIIKRGAFYALYLLWQSQPPQLPLAPILLSLQDLLILHNFVSSFPTLNVLFDELWNGGAFEVVAVRSERLDELVEYMHSFDHSGLFPSTLNLSSVSTDNNNNTQNNSQLNNSQREELAGIRELVVGEMRQYLTTTTDTTIDNYDNHYISNNSIESLSESLLQQQYEQLRSELQLTTTRDLQRNVEIADKLGTVRREMTTSLTRFDSSLMSLSHEPISATQLSRATTTTESTFHDSYGWSDEEFGGMGGMGGMMDYFGESASSGPSAAQTTTTTPLIDSLLEFEETLWDTFPM